MKWQGRICGADSCIERRQWIPCSGPRGAFRTRYTSRLSFSMIWTFSAEHNLLCIDAMWASETTVLIAILPLRAEVLFAERSVFYKLFTPGHRTNTNTNSIFPTQSRPGTMEKLTLTSIPSLHIMDWKPPNHRYVHDSVEWPHFWSCFESCSVCFSLWYDSKHISKSSDCQLIIRNNSM